ncbi:MAG: hypothetical protein C4520_21700 [Candidatus Abyssobacteria bacterium SURF_5]|uniref:Spore protein YkvP/CgeB glycosyl transferase-like domain-containing protein n=1 Tax=Abyssobacteria bacterium (strain SURF_5) TaxID=2093360 RepID=A0A3A4NI42_ABYX5|nr:MAG: hypothetical protein C4520_21700 [Candidatus Abyssubacteria bacterium SURF_5]
MKRTYSIAFFGSSLVSAYWNGAATYYRGIIRNLHERGHRITFYEPDIYERQKHRDIPEPPYARSVVYRAENEGDVLVALSGVRDADIVVKASGVGRFDDVLEEAVLQFKRPNNLVVYWDVDAPATLERIRSNPADPFRPLIPLYDLVLTYGGGDPVVSGYTALGARMCVPVYNALDPTTHHPVPPDDRFRAAVGFLGNRLPDREQRVFEFFFAPARGVPKELFLLGGNGWDHDVPDLPNVKYLGHVYTRDHNAFNCTPRMILNINRESMANYGYSPPTRVFEAAGAGACLVTDAWEGIELFLEPNKECLLAERGADVVEHLATVSPDRARGIGRSALERVLSEHTYARRSEQVESILQNVL